MNSSQPTPSEKIVTPDTGSGLSAPSPRPPSGGRSVFTNARFWGFVGFIVLVLVPLFFRVPFTTFCFAVITFLEVVLLFNILIIVHELGHFLAARWCGLKVEKFAIWFGKPLWSKKIDGVEYVLGSIPAGGYVALPQMAPMEAIEGKTDTPKEDLPPASPWHKIIVAFAGPLFSFGLALVFACIVWVAGRPVGYSEGTTIIGAVLPNYPAAKAGVLPGDKILSIDGHSIARFIGNDDSVIWRILTSTADTIPVVVQRGADTLTFNIKPERDPKHEHHWYQRSPTRKIGIGPAEQSIIIKKLYPDSPALVAGLQPKDQIVQMNGQPLYSWDMIAFWLKDHPYDPITFQILRQGETKTIVVTPEKPISPTVIEKDLPQTNIGIKELEEDKVTLVYPNPYVQVRDSIQAVTGTLSALSHSNVGASQLSGPIGIMNILFAVLSSENGWRLALWFAVLINVNLALINLFPFPILDGGHILLSVIEWIRRRPLSMVILEPLQTACALVLISYMLFITFFDVQDSGKIAMNAGGGEVKFAPKQSP
jgi:regulator of sigma E protease